MRPLTNVQTGTLGGALCSVWASITLGEIFQTVVMAIIGSIISYMVSRLLSKKPPD